MTRCVALLRGIGPGNPNMRNENLRLVCTEVGLHEVTTVISSGNVVFDTEATDLAALETVLEEAWPERLGFRSTTIIRTRQDLLDLVDLEPFGSTGHGPDSYLLVTFSKFPLSIDTELPYRPPARNYQVVGATRREIFTMTGPTDQGNADVMTWVEKRFGKQITSRTWLTVNRILKRMG